MNISNFKTIITSTSLVLVFGLVGCSGQYASLGSSLLNSAGIGGSGSSDPASLLTAIQKGAKAVEGLDERQEYYLGRSVSATILGKYPLLNKPGLSQYVNRVGAALVAHSDRPETFGGYHFGVLDTSEVNAVSGPGGFVLVSRGLLELMPNEDALAAVLAHEIGHVVLGHGVKAVSKANMTQALLMVGKEAASSYGNNSVKAVSAVFGDSVNDVVESLLTKGFSRSAEYDADAYGAALLMKTGYNPNAMVLMLEAVSKGKKDSGGWYSTHPSPDNRISEVRDAIKVSKDDTVVLSNQKIREGRFASNTGKKAVK